MNICPSIKSQSVALTRGENDSGFLDLGSASPVGSAYDIRRTGHLRIQLLRAGVESNPGPPKWPCLKCGWNAPNSCIRCNTCFQWCHCSCSSLDPNNLPFSWSCGYHKESPKDEKNLRILQFNCNGIHGKLEEILLLMEKNQCQIVPCKKLSSPRSRT